MTVNKWFLKKRILTSIRKWQVNLQIQRTITKLLLLLWIHIRLPLCLKPQSHRHGTSTKLWRTSKIKERVKWVIRVNCHKFQQIQHQLFRFQSLHDIKNHTVTSHRIQSQALLLLIEYYQCRWKLNKPQTPVVQEPLTWISRTLGLNCLKTHSSKGVKGYDQRF